VASRDYSGTPLSQKLGAKPGAGVVVFTTSREDLDRHIIVGMRGALCVDEDVLLG
jgi:hypothetical protein